jgi:hypothetical protein
MNETKTKKWRANGMAMGGKGSEGERETMEAYPDLVDVAGQEFERRVADGDKLFL